MKKNTENTENTVYVSPIRRMEFTQEGSLVVFFSKEGKTGWDIAKEEFQDACEYQATQSVCIVPTQSLQEMGYSSAF